MSSNFAELAACSHYSFLEGSSSPRELVAVAADLGIGALGLCDRNGLYGAVGFVEAAQKAGIHPVIGAELDLVGGARLRLLARCPTGYQQLCRAISAAQLAGEKGQPLLDLGLDDRSAAASAEQASASRRRPTLDPPQRPAALRPTAGPFPTGWPGLPSQRLKTPGPPSRLDPAELSGCTVLAGGPDSAIVHALIAGDRRGAARRTDQLREAFGRDRIALLLTHHLHPADGWLLAETAALAQRCGLPMVASNTPVHAIAGKKPLLDVLTAIRHRTTLERAAAYGLLLPNTEHRLKSERELRALLGAYPEAFDHAAHIARQCSLSLDFSDVRFPGFAVPPGETPFSVLYALCQQALPQRYRPITSAVAARLQRELHVIEKTGLAEFFLIVHDIMRFARDRSIPGQGRGSAADSIVAYLLGITRVDPVAHDLLFERFLHEDHQGTPDIDIDFSTEHREDVIQYVYERYGPERTGMVANVITFRPRMSVRQVGAAFGFPEHIIDRLAKSVDSWIWGSVDEALKTAGLEHMVAGENLQDVTPGSARSGSTAPGSAPSHEGRARNEFSQRGPKQWELFLDMCAQVMGTPRHLGIHVGGMLVTGRPLVEVAPVERATMPGRVVVQFNKDDVEDLGLIKMDLLGLRTLGMVADCLDMVAQQSGERIDLDALPLDDSAVYDSICAPDTIGLFQIESRAQQQSLYQSQPREFNDLIVQVAIIRPGPIQGNAVHPYLRRRQGLEPVTYLHPSLEPILADTRGVVLYQEQILRIVMEIAGYSAGEADRFRRAMNRHRGREEMAVLREEFIARCAANGGLPEAVAEEIFKSVAGFALYGFCKSHAAAFARTAYETAWLRLNHPAAYLAGLLNAQPMGFYHPSVLIEDAKRHGVATLPLDVTRSRARSGVEWIGDEAPPLPAVRNRLAPGWRIEGDALVTDNATRRPLTPGEQAARVAVRTATRARIAPHPWAVRLGFGYLRNLGPSARAACDEAVRAGAAGSIRDFWCHTLLPRPAMENLVLVGAFDAVYPGRSRRELLWELREPEDTLPSRRRMRSGAAALAADRARLTSTVMPQDCPPTSASAVAQKDDHALSAPEPAQKHHIARSPSGPASATTSASSRPAGAPRGRASIAGSRPGDAACPARDLDADALGPLLTAPAAAPPLPVMSARERTTTEYRLSELSTGPHLVAFMRPQLDRLGCTVLDDVRGMSDRTRLRVGGLVIARQAPMTAKGFRFFTLADETGHLDLVFRPAVVRRTRSIANFHPLLLVDGILEVEHGRFNLLVSDVAALDKDGQPLTPARAFLGGGANRDAPPPQHGFTRPVDACFENVTGAAWQPPQSHDFH